VADALLKGAHEHLQAADLVLEKDRELPDARGLKAGAAFGHGRKNFFHRYSLSTADEKSQQNQCENGLIAMVELW
jgi:hypothetical protein